MRKLVFLFFILVSSYSWSQDDPLGNGYGATFVSERLNENDDPAFSKLKVPKNYLLRWQLNLVFFDGLEQEQAFASIIIDNTEFANPVYYVAAFKKNLKGQHANILGDENLHIGTNSKDYYLPTLIGHDACLNPVYRKNGRIQYFQGSIYR